MSNMRKREEEKQREEDTKALAEAQARQQGIEEATREMEAGLDDVDCKVVKVEGVESGEDVTKGVGELSVKKEVDSGVDVAEGVRTALAKVHASGGKKRQLQPGAVRRFKPPSVKGENHDEIAHWLCYVSLEKPSQIDAEDLEFLKKLKKSSIEAMKHLKGSPLRKLMSDIPEDPLGVLGGFELLERLALNRCEGEVRDISGTGMWEPRWGPAPQSRRALGHTCLIHVSHWYVVASFVLRSNTYHVWRPLVPRKVCCGDLWCHVPYLYSYL